MEVRTGSEQVAHKFTMKSVRLIINVLVKMCCRYIFTV